MRMLRWAALVTSLTGLVSAGADEVTVLTQESEAAAGLDLKAVGQLVQEVRNPEELERKLNEPDLGINNLDLNNDGDVDYLRVVSKDDGDTRVMILQAPLGKDDFQDVATIQVDRDETGVPVLQVQGDPVLYGPDYYVVPAGVRVAAFPLVTWAYSPLYRPWVSTVYWGFYPRWWHPWRAVPFAVYRPRVVGYTRVTFVVTNRGAVVRARAVYTPPAVSGAVQRPTRASMAEHAVVVHEGPDADKTLRAERVKETDEGPRTTALKQTNDRGDDGSTTKTRTKTRKTQNEAGIKARKTKKTKKA